MTPGTVCEWVARGAGHSPCEAGHLSRLTLSVEVPGIGLRLVLDWASCPVLPSSLVPGNVTCSLGEETWVPPPPGSSPLVLQSQSIVSSSWLMSQCRLYFLNISRTLRPLLCSKPRVPFHLFLYPNVSGLGQLRWFCEGTGIPCGLILQLCALSQLYPM